MQASEVSVPKRPSPRRFARSGRLFILVCPPPHLHHSVCLSFLHAPPLCPMPLDPLLCFACPSSPTNTTFRVSWWIVFLLRWHQSTRVERCDPPIISPISFSPTLALESASFLLLSSSFSFFSLLSPPFFTPSVSYLAVCTHLRPCFCLF
jgi:hypothetical protein